MHATEYLKKEKGFTGHQLGGACENQAKNFLEVRKKGEK